MNISSNICCHQENSQQCSHKSCKTYGSYCKKHRKMYLLKDNHIILERFTCNISDYTLDELKRYYIRFIHAKKHSQFRKKDYFKYIFDKFMEIQSGNITDKQIIKIQSYIRKYNIQQLIKYKGISFFNRKVCNNEEDFYTYEPKNNIEDKYYFSYKDSNDNYWCFDVRSVKKLIDMNYGNPYTTEPIPDDIKCKVHNYIKMLSNQNQVIHIVDQVIQDRKTIVKQKYVDLFSQIEYSGYSCDVNWILDLNSIKLKKLYKELEDIWNYRANLSNEVKCDISPPDGRLFVMPVSDYINCNSKLELLEILANELIKILGARSVSNMNLGFMYIIIGLSMVSRPCFMIHQDWVKYVFS